MALYLISIHVVADVLNAEKLITSRPGLKLQKTIKQILSHTCLGMACKIRVVHRKYYNFTKL